MSEGIAVSGATDVGFDDTDLERRRRDLTAHCYRMVVSSARPRVRRMPSRQTLVRAWRPADSFEGRSSLRTWLYRIATNVCLDMLASKQRRIRPSAPSAGHDPLDVRGCAAEPPGPPVGRAAAA
jgi:RNA polymerase sigma-70 factor (ECF subfamily)